MKFFKIITVLVATFALGMYTMSYFCESKLLLKQNIHDFHALVKALHDVEDLADLESGIEYRGTIYEESFNNIKEVAYSMDVFDKISAIRNQLYYIEDLEKNPLKQTDIEYFKEVSVNLSSYVNDFNDYIARAQDGTIIDSINI